MGTDSPDELSPAALRMRDAIEQRLFAAPPSQLRRERALDEARERALHEIDVRESTEEARAPSRRSRR